MNGGKIIFFGLILTVGVLAAAKGGAVNHLAEADARCASISSGSGDNNPESSNQRKDNSLDRGQGLGDCCGILREIKAEFSAWPAQRDQVRLKHFQEAMADLIARKQTPSLADAKGFCNSRLYGKNPPPVKGKTGTIAKKMRTGCDLLQLAQSEAVRRGKISPRPLNYFDAVAAARVTAASVVTLEETWRIYDKENR
ncbi:MAG: hypothetical protein NTX59_10960 [Elusimicrobia bacterium]|nr:hypothetical protein [Elusimicrobiota bacterium]